MGPRIWYVPGSCEEPGLTRLVRRADAPDYITASRLHLVPPSPRRPVTENVLSRFSVYDCR
jgi:hypothetical protein